MDDFVVVGRLTEGNFSSDRSVHFFSEEIFQFHTIFYCFKDFCRETIKHLEEMWPPDCKLQNCVLNFQVQDSITPFFYLSVLVLHTGHWSWVPIFSSFLFLHPV